MTSTARLGLPFIAAEQAHKHVTHNEALLLLDAVVQLRITARDATDPPPDPGPGQVFAIGAGAAGVWAGRQGQLAVWTTAGWRYLHPRHGWLGWDQTRGEPVTFEGGQWRALFAGLEELGIGTQADAVNRLAVRTEAALFTAVPAGDGGNGDVRLTLNKEALDDSATLIFQSGWSGRAEMGLSGTDDFVFKVSPDGGAWFTAIALERASGCVRFDRLFGSAVSYPRVAGGVLDIATSYAVPAPENGTSDDIETITGGFDGAMLVLTGTAGTMLTLRDGAGNLKLGGDRVLDNFEDSLMLVRRGTDWIELSYADNG